MSNQNPPGGPSRRRRIAGERKGAARPDGAEPDQTTDAPAPVAAPASSGVGSAFPGDEPASRGVEPVETRRPVSPRVLAALGVVAVVLVAFAASGFGIDGLGLSSWRTVDEESQVSAAERTAPATAERAAVAILSYSHQSLEADRDNAAKFMTGSYRKEYLETFGLVLDNAPEVQAVVEAEVRASGVAHADPDRVNVLLFVNQTTTSTANQGEPQTALNRVMLTMQESDGSWLVDDITSY